MAKSSIQIKINLNHRPSLADCPEPEQPLPPFSKRKIAIGLLSVTLLVGGVTSGIVHALSSNSADVKLAKGTNPVSPSNQASQPLVSASLDANASLATNTQQNSQSMLAKVDHQPAASQPNTEEPLSGDRKNIGEQPRHSNDKNSGENNDEKSTGTQVNSAKQAEQQLGETTQVEQVLDSVVGEVQSLINKTAEVVGIKEKPSKAKIDNKPGEIALSNNVSAELNQITRVQLAYNVKNKEPVGEVPKFLAAQNKTIKLYFFTELANYQFPVVTHRWIWRDKVVSEVTLDVKAKNWRTWSNKRVLWRWQGDWRVEVLDGNNNIMFTQHFTYGS
ncbi:hypothetical protein C2869_08535 [Saccharobesus litoralis]|uniref:DUF2914 domain-containing protein n=1 Tax=Saccharobesus litoralis TaxID=2172099 RepID=A0A2S0VQH8_9ALTE|nr:DUF2914 domain-containing protein [Saccharobesus litoralis]AWB66471.1 hypothetical protein C2869_08535 [Saccharobesus litoralis]